MPVDYSKAKIYKLESPSGLVYIGSTCRPLSERKAAHKSAFKSWLNGKANYVTSYKLFEEDVDNVEIYLIEKYSCDSKEELVARESSWIRTVNCVNKMLVGGGAEETKEKRAEKIDCFCGSSIRRSDYAKHCLTRKHIVAETEEHQKPKLNNVHKIETRINLESGKLDEKYSKKILKNVDLQLTKLVDQKNIEEVEKLKLAKRKALMPVQVKQTAEQLELRRAEKIDCSCGSSVRRSDYAKHSRTSTHIRNAKA